MLLTRPSDRWGALAAARPRLCLVLLCLACWLPGFFTLPPGDRDESRFAEATKQMLLTGDYVRIWNGHQPRNLKPIGIYWLQAPFAAVLPARANPVWPYRMPALLGGIAAVLATYDLGLTLLADRRRALAAAAMLAACFVLSFETHIAKTDAALLGATTWAQAMLARAWRRGPLGRGEALVLWVATGAGMLIKGPITPLVAGVTALTVALATRRAAWLRGLRAAWGLPLALAMVVPWLVAIGVATHGQFFEDSLGGDMGRKLAGGQEGHGFPPGFHLLLLPLLAFPSTLWMIAALRPAWRARGEAPVAFLLSWLLPCWLIFEAVPTKLPHYTLPLYPALFLLAAWAGPARSRAGEALLVLAGLAVAALGLAAPLALGAPWWLGIPVPLAAGLIAAFALRGHIAAAIACAPLLTLAILQWEVPRLTPLWVAPRAAALIAPLPGRPASGADIVITGFSEPSLMFLLGPEVDETYGGANAAAALAQGRDVAVVEGRQRPAFEAAAARLGLRLRRLGEVMGFDPASGHRVTLTVFAR